MRQTLGEVRAELMGVFVDVAPVLVSSLRLIQRGLTPLPPRPRATLHLLALALRRLVGCFLGAGVGLYVGGSEGTLRGAGAAVGAPPRDGQGVAHAESRQVNARNVLEVISALGGRTQLKNQCRRHCAHVEASDRRTLAVKEEVTAGRFLVPFAGDLVCHVRHELFAVTRRALRGHVRGRDQGERGQGRGVRRVRCHEANLTLLCVVCHASPRFGRGRAVAVALEGQVCSVRTQRPRKTLPVGGTSGKENE